MESTAIRLIAEDTADRLPRRLKAIEGQVPAVKDFPKGCRFHPRCPHVLPKCPTEAPPLVHFDAEHRVACWLEEEAPSAPVELGSS